MNAMHKLRRAWSALADFAASMTPFTRTTLTIGDLIRIAEAERIRMEAQQLAYEAAFASLIADHVRQEIYADIRAGRIVVVRGELRFIDEFVPPPSVPPMEGGATGTQARQPARGST